MLSQEEEITVVDKDHFTGGSDNNLEDEVDPCFETSRTKGLTSSNLPQEMPLTLFTIAKRDSEECWYTKNLRDANCFNTVVR